MANKYFPKDCTEDCPHYKRYDLSVDDYTNICRKLNVQVDDMDAYGPFYVPFICPLEEKPDEETDIKPTALTSDTGLNLVEIAITNMITENVNEYTNGGIFKKVFKPYGIDETKDNIVIVWLSEKDKHGIPISKEWWNAPFKGE